MKLELTGAAALVILAMVAMLLGSSEVSSSRAYSKKAAGEKAHTPNLPQSTPASPDKETKVDTVAERSSSSQKDASFITIDGTDDSGARIEALEKLPN